MEAITMIKDRRSVRNYKNEKVDMNLMKEIVELCKWSPSWANYQIARYTLIGNEEIIQKLGNESVNDFVYNMDTLKNAKSVLILSYVKGKSGKLDQSKLANSSDKSNQWEMFDSGIACQTFCLAAHAKGIGTCIMGVIDEDSIAKIINLPEEESVAALIVYGYPEGNTTPTSRMNLDEIVRVIN